MVKRDSANDVDNVVKDSSGDGIEDDDIDEEFSSEMPSMAWASAPPGRSLYASLHLPPTSKVNEDDGHSIAHGTSSVTKKLEHAPPNEDSVERPPVVVGAFPVRSSHNTVPTTRTTRSPIIAYDSTRDLSVEESEQVERVPNSTGSYTGVHDTSRIVAGRGLYTVEAQRVPDGNEEGTVMVAEAQSLRMKWYQRRWIFVGLSLFACCLVSAVVVMAVLFVRQPGAASSSLLTSSTTAPITGTPSTSDPTAAPPTRLPTRGALATPNPTGAPRTMDPIALPTSFSSAIPSQIPSAIPSHIPSAIPSPIPSHIPSDTPSIGALLTN